MNKSSGTIYELSLMGLISLLDRCGDVAWRDSIKHHLDLWRSSGESEVHRTIYGGMGSFNDLVICEYNGHNVEPDQEPWVNTLLMYLQSLALEYSRKPTVLPDESKIMWSLRPDRVIIQGWRCLRCGYSEASPTDIDAYLCGRFLKAKIAACFLTGDVEDIVDSCLKMEFEGLDEARALTASSLEAISAKVQPAEDWNEPCPKCNEHDKAVYSWEVDENNKISPCPDNLPLRK